MIQFNRKTLEESLLAKRVAQIVGIDESKPPYYSNGKWILNNNWWLGIIDETTASLSCNKPIGDLESDALIIVIEFLL